jgi:hypothetical protein
MSCVGTAKAPALRPSAEKLAQPIERFEPVSSRQVELFETHQQDFEEEPDLDGQFDRKAKKL